MVKSYYALRGVEQPDLQQAAVPAYMLPERDQPILDFGCGLGELLHALRAAGWNQIAGADVDAAAIAQRRASAIEVHDLGTSAGQFFAAHAARYALVVMSHVLERIPKSEMVKTLRRVRLLLAVYKVNRQLLTKVTSSSYHRPSPVVCSYEITLLARPR